MDPTKWYEAPTQKYYPYAHCPNPGGGDAPAPAPGIGAQYSGHAKPYVYPVAGAAAAEAEASYNHGFGCGDAQGLPAKDANQHYGVRPVAYGDRFESDAIAVSKEHSKDREYIEELENKLRNCLQEIEFLQDQLNLRNAEVDCLGEHVHSLELKLSDVSNLQEKMRMLRDEVVECESHCSFFMYELEHKEAQLWKSKLHIEKLEAAISSVALESQCEVESMKLDITALEQRYFEAERLCDQAVQEKTRMEALFGEYTVQFKEAQHTVSCREKENKELLDKLRSSEEKTKALLCKAHDELNVWMKNNHWTAVCGPGEVDKHLLMKLEEDLPLPSEMSKVLKEQRISLTAIKDFHDARDQAEARS